MRKDDYMAVRRLQGYFRQHYMESNSDEAFLAWLAECLPQLVKIDAAAPKRTDPPPHPKP